MSAEKSLAIVLRVVEFSESSCIVTMYTRDFGKIGALAKGARRRKSPFEGAIDVLAVCRIVFLHKSTDALDLLTEAKLERSFRSARNDLHRLYCGYYVVELLNALTDDYDANREIFDLSQMTLESLDAGQDLASTVLHYELNLLRLSGHFPSLDNCVVCGTPVASSRRIAFGLIAGGVICPQCRLGQRKVIQVSSQVVDTMRQAIEPAGRNPRNNGLPTERRGELRAVMNQYVAHQLGRVPKLRAFLNGILN